MKRRHFLSTSLATSAGLLYPHLSQSEPQHQPNFVFIYIDDMGWKDVGFMGSNYYETPNIDRLAREGMIFTNAYACAPNCAPSRACLMSGQYSPRHGIYTVSTSERGKSKNRKLIPTKNNTVLPPSTITLAERLKANGYTCCHAGKWHLGHSPNAGPLQQGFEMNTGGRDWGAPKTYFSPYGNPNLPDGPEGEYLTDRLTQDSIAFIEEHKDQPFFLYLSHYAVHTPIQAKQELIAKYTTKKGDDLHNNPTYAAMIESVDQSVGNIMQTLDRLDLTDNTVVIFFSDNGGHGVYTDMAPLRGSKGMLYEGGIREPMIVRWPKKIRAGAVCHTPVIGVDFYPTLLDLAGIKPPQGQVMDGLSLKPLLTETDTLNRDTLYWHFPAYLEAYKRDGGPWRTTPVGAIRHGDYKLLEFFEDGRLELYNLKDDIGETTNLAKQLPEKTQELHKKMLAWRKQVNAPVPTQLNPDYSQS